MNLAKVVDCLPEDLCDAIVATEHEFNECRVLYKETQTFIPSEIRTSTACRLSPDFHDTAHELVNKALTSWSKQIAMEYPPEVVNCLLLPGYSSGLETRTEGLCLLRYEEGQRYVWHCDATPTAVTSARIVSVVVYLNDDFTGGETEMASGMKVSPKKGKALIFPSNNNYPHRALPVSDGTKYALVTWYNLVC